MELSSGLRKSCLRRARAQIEQLQECFALQADFCEKALEDLLTVLLHAWRSWQLGQDTRAIFETCYHFLRSLSPKPHIDESMCSFDLGMLSGSPKALPAGFSTDDLLESVKTAQVFEDLDLGPVPPELDFWVVKQSLLKMFCVLATGAAAVPGSARVCLPLAVPRLESASSSIQ